MKNYLAFDLGGTKLSCGVVSAQGQILSSHKESAHIAEGPDSLIRQMVQMAKDQMAKFSGISEGAVASAGPLDPVNGVLLDPTNFFTDGKSWGVFPLIEQLKKHLPVKLHLENDAAAAVLAEHWVGLSQSYSDCVQMTLGTGVGIGVVINNQLLRSGRNLHPEVSHIKLNAFDISAPCGCGQLGCMEAYLSGTNFTHRLEKLWNWQGLLAEQVVKLAKESDSKALAAFSEYAQMFALAVDELVVLFAPQAIVLSGGFSSAADLFLQKSQILIEDMLKRRRDGVDLRPKILVSKFKDEIGLIGAARVAMLKK